MGRKVWSFLLLALLLLLWWANARAGTLVIGRVSNNPDKTYRELRPILDYVVGHLEDLGVTSGSVLVAKDKEEIIKFLKEGKVDWVQKGVFQAILYSQEAGAEIFLRSWREGAPTYYSVIFTRKDSNINSLNDLKGKKVAFQDPGSTSAFFIPLAALRRAGLELVELPSPRDKAPASKVAYAFAGDELSIATWVHRRLTEAGAFHNQDWEGPTHNPPAIKKDLKIIYRSKPLPRMIELVRKDLDPKIKARIKEVLLKAHEDPAAREALKSYGPETARFDQLSKEELEEAKEMLKYVAKDVK